MESSDKKQGKKNIPQVQTFTVPSALGEIKANITVNTNTPSKPSKEQIINQAIQFHLKGNIPEAKKYYKYCINQGFNDHQVFSNYGIILQGLGKLQEAEISTRKAIELNPNFAEAHNNLGNILRDLGNLKEAEISTRKAIELNPDYAQAHSNLGILLKDIGELKDAEFSYRKAIKVNPDLAEAHYNLGNLFKDIGKFQKAEVSYQKAIELKPDWQTYFFYAACIFERKEFEIVKNKLLEAKSIAIKKYQKEYINSALKATKLAKNNLINSERLEIAKGARSLININKNRLILHRQSEDELLSYLYGVKNRALNNTLDARYGKGFCSQDLHFFDDQSPIISNLSDDLKRICGAELGLKEIMIYESFFNIFKSGSSAGAKIHNHIGKKDLPFGLTFYKYSLIYYLQVGDQSGEDPGKLKLYEPDEEILPDNNMLIIIGADRNHSVSYLGRKDRVVISANFFGF